MTGPSGGHETDLTKDHDERPENAEAPPVPADINDSFDSTIEILERARAGDRGAAEILIERALPTARRWAHGRLPGYARAGADTGDVVQDAVLQVLKGLDRFEHRKVGALPAYLRQAILNKIRDEIRRTGRRGVGVELPDTLDDRSPTPLEQAIMNERTERFQEALKRLSQEDRRAIVWRIELGYSFAEVAEALGKTSPDAARMAVSRALSRLAKLMGLEALRD